MAKRRAKKPKKLQASANFTKSQLSYLERRRKQLQDEINKTIRREKDPLRKEILKVNRTSLTKANLGKLLQSEDTSYSQIKSIFNDISSSIKVDKVKLDDVIFVNSNENKLKVDPVVKNIFYIDEDKVTRRLMPGETLYEKAEEGSIASMQYDVRQSLIDELNAKIIEVNERIGEHRLTGKDEFNIMPDYFSRVEVENTLTDEASYRREIKRLDVFLKKDAFDIVKTGDETQGITKGEKEYLESRLIEENKRRAESIQFQEEELKRTGRLQSQHEYQQKPIEFEKYTKEQLRKRSELYTDIRLEERSELWKANYIKMLKNLDDTVRTTNTVSQKDKDYVSKKVDSIIDLLSKMDGIQVKNAILGSPDIDIPANYPDADLVKETVDRAYDALVYYSNVGS